MSVKNEFIERTIRHLTKLKVDFVIEVDGELVSPSYTSLVARPKPKRNGERSAYIDQYLELLSPGDEIHIPFGVYTKEQIGSMASSRSHIRFGKGNYCTQSDDAGVTVLCLDICPSVDGDDDDV